MLLRFFAVLFLCAATPLFAAWPEKPIKVFIGYAPGGSTETDIGEESSTRAPGARR